MEGALNKSPATCWENEEIMGSLRYNIETLPDGCAHYHHLKFEQ